MRRLLPLVLLLTACTGHRTAAPPHSSLRIVYGGTSPETVDVDRPYRARRGALLWSEAGTFLLQDGRAQQTAVTAPGFPGPYSRLDLALPEAAAQHLVRALGTTQVIADRPCHDWESRQPLDGAPFAPATATERTVTCVDDALGVVLADTWTQRGTVLQQRRATSVGSGPSLAGDALYGGSAPTLLPTSPNGTVATRTSPQSLLGTLGLPVPGAPPGLVLDRSVALVSTRSASAVLTFTSRTQLVVLELRRNLASLGDGPVARGRAVRVGTRTGRLEPVLAGLRLTLPGPRGLTAVVTADLPRDVLLGWAGGLQLGA